MSNPNMRGAPIQVEGVAETIRELRKVDKKIAAASIKKIKAPAQATAMRLKGVAPRVPLSGMGDHGPTKVSVRYGGRGVSNTVGARGVVSNVVKVVLVGPGWTSTSDIAHNASAGESMVPNLTRKYGGPSRWAWPTVEADMPRLTTAIKAACVEVQEETTRILAPGGLY